MRWVQRREAEYEGRFGRWAVLVYKVPHNGGRWHVGFRCADFDLPGSYQDLEDAMRIAERITDVELWTGMREAHER